MGWNHRVLVTEHKHSDGSIEQYLQVHEVYYDEEGVPNASTKNAVNISGEDIMAINWQLEKIEECLGKPFLWGDDRFPLEYKKIINKK